MSDDFNDFSKEEKIDIENESKVSDTADKNAGPGFFAKDSKIETHPKFIALQEELSKSQSEAKENYEKFVRATAEVDNVKRRADIKISHAHKFGNEKFIKEILNVVDSLEHAIENINSSAGGTKDAMLEGLELTMQQFLSVLAKFDVVQINPVDEIFMPEEHEALSVVDSEEKKQNEIVAVVRKGYKLYERVLRPARVIVAK